MNATLTINAEEDMIEPLENEKDEDILPEKQFRHLYEQMGKLCQNNKWGDPFSYARAKEICTASILGHRVAETFSGADGYSISESGERIEYEYKSTTDNKVKGSYTGISNKPTWEEQKKYLTEEKIGKYPFHYYSRYSVTGCEEIWEVPSSYVLNKAISALCSKFDNNGNILPTKSADPRFSFTFNNKDIINNGTKVYPKPESSSENST